jgi:hypothetical protein
MAIKIDHILGEGTIKVISRIDGALDCTEDQYASYLETLDESTLNFKAGEDPTRFVLRKTLPYKLGQKVKSQQIRMDKGEMFLNSSFIAEEVKYSLVDIENPPSVPTGSMLKFDGFKVDGLMIASDETMKLLSALEIVNDLYTARKNYVEHGGGVLKKS